jgi:predicted Zn-dependent protease
VRRLAAACGAIGLLLLAAACTPQDLPPRAPGERPPDTSDEAGLWMMFDDIEQRLATSGQVVDDPALKSYLQDIVCRLSPAYCADIRVYVVRDPRFNASMAPNGSMQVWTGLLLRAKDEAQLAAVLGHEIGHYTERHSIERWNQIIATTDAATFFSIAAGAAGAGAAGNVGQIIALLSIYAYSRDQERQADEIGFNMMARAGYDPLAAAELWRGLIEERDAGREATRKKKKETKVARENKDNREGSGDEEEDDSERPSVYLSTHPTPEERMQTLSDKAAALAAASGRERASARFAGAIGPHRSEWLQSLFGVRDFARNRVVLDRLLADAVNPGELHYFDGEFYRLRGEEGDDHKAVAAYQSAIALGGAPPAVHRALGNSLLRQGRRAEAKAAFEFYLSVAPDAPDWALIEAEAKNL